MAGLALAGPGKDPLKPRVPTEQMESAKTLGTPLFRQAKQAPPRMVVEGKALYEGKGACSNCHGKGGKGDGPAGNTLDPSPRNFTNCDLQGKRTDGELFGVVKNGIEGTAMMAFTPSALTEEEAWKTIAYVRSFCKS